MDDLALAAGNAATFWTRIARARGYTVSGGDGFVSVTGDAQYGLRVLTLRPTLSRADHAEIADLAQRPGRVVIEDAFNAVDLTALGLSQRQLPVMIRDPSPTPPPSIPVRPALDPASLRTVERIVVDGFALEHFQPYAPGVVLPDALLADLEFYLTDVDGTPAGACVAVPEPGAGPSPAPNAAAASSATATQTSQAGQPAVGAATAGQAGEGTRAARAGQPAVGAATAGQDGQDAQAARAGQPAAGVTEAAQSSQAVVGLYWVTTMPEFRSRGVGRALMHAVLRRFHDRPVTLTASRAGRPLYESLGFRRLAEATWWSPAQ